MHGTHTQCKPQYSKARPKLNRPGRPETNFEQFRPILPIFTKKNTHRTDIYMHLTVAVIQAKQGSDGA